MTEKVIFHVDYIQWMESFILECQEKGFNVTAAMMRLEITKLQERIKNGSSLETT